MHLTSMYQGKLLALLLLRSRFPSALSVRIKIVLSLFCLFALVKPQVKRSAGEPLSVCIFRLSVHSSHSIFTLCLV